MRVMMQEGRKFYYPDLSIVCGEPIYRDEKKTSLTNPRVLIEVLSLSPSTESFDREEKFAAYASIASLTDYVLVSQHQPWIEHFTREGERWIYEIATGLEGSLDIPSIGCRLALGNIYDRIEFPPARQAAI